MAEKIGIRPATITLKGSKVLLVKSLYEEEEFFLFPGGGLEFGETLKEGAIRETFEETGIKVKIKKLIHINEYIYKKDWAKRSITSFFLAEPIDEKDINIQTTDGGKIKEAIWMEIKNLDKIDLRPKILIEYLKNFINKKESSIPFYSIDYKE